MKTVTMTDDFSATQLRVVKVMCECGWLDKAYRQDAKKRAMNHIRVRHGEGLMVYKDQRIFVDELGGFVD